MKLLKYFTSHALPALLAYIPFHAIITTYVISYAGHAFIVKGFKDMVVFAAYLCALAIFFKNRTRLYMGKSMIFASFIMLFVLSTVLISIFNQNTDIEKVAGGVILLRPVLMLFLGTLTAIVIANSDMENKTLKIVMTASVVVVAFGFLQVFLLPKDFLSIFGYGAETIKPYQTIDNNESFIRILSTLRGPNPLGAYLAMLAPLGLYWLGKIKSNKYLKAGAYSVFFITTIYGAQSRSAWIGLLVGLITYALLMNKNKKRLIQYFVAILPLIAAGYLLRNTQFVQNTIFHNDPNEGNSINSDDQRISSLTYALRSVNEKPFGHGVGSSGPASNYGSSPVIIENQYLDIAYQIGWLGLVCYLGIVICVGWMLIRQGSGLSYALFSGLVAVSIIALFWPVWTDETVALTWWGLAGIVISSGIVHKKKKQ